MIHAGLILLNDIYIPSTWLFSCSFAIRIGFQEMAESDIASEYGVPQFKCIIKQQKKEHYEGHDETDDEVYEHAAASVKVSTEGIIIWGINILAVYIHCLNFV